MLNEDQAMLHMTSSIFWKPQEMDSVSSIMRLVRKTKAGCSFYYNLCNAVTKLHNGVERDCDFSPLSNCNIPLRSKSDHHFRKYLPHMKGIDFARVLPSPESGRKLKWVTQVDYGWPPHHLCRKVFGSAWRSASSTNDVMRLTFFPWCSCDGLILGRRSWSEWSTFIFPSFSHQSIQFGYDSWEKWLNTWCSH